MKNKNNHLYLDNNFIVLLAIFMWLSFTAFIRPLSLPDEGRYVGVALEMLNSHDWSTPALNGLPFFHKPPLFYWLTALGMLIFGVNEWAARLAPIIGASLTIWAMFLFVGKWSNKTHAYILACSLATMPLFFAVSQYANLDMLVCACISITIILFINAILSIEQSIKYKASLFGAFIFAGLGLLAKGLIGIALPAIILILWCIFTQRKRRLKHLFSPYGLLLFALVGMPWFVYMQIKYANFYDYFFVYQHFKRFTGHEFNNQQPIWFFVPVLLVLNLPWTFYLYNAYKLYKTTKIVQTINKDIHILMWIWLMVVLVFFSLPQSKLVGYILPCIPPIAYLISYYLAQKFDQGIITKLKLKIMLIGSAIFCVIIVFVALYIAPYTSKSLRFLPIKADDQILMLDYFVYDMPFYLKLKAPILVASNWHDIEGIKKNDNWKKELFDAAEFNTSLANKLFVDIKDMNKISSILCAKKNTWIISKYDDKNYINSIKFPWLKNAQTVYVNKHIQVWKFTVNNNNNNNENLNCVK
jgi:4-amino-4-deoxy-L-arabinose transferase-like glycosyltransferase